MTLAFKIKSYLLLTLAAATAFLSGCKDDLDFHDIGEGEARVECEVNFVPLVNALGSRTPGNAIKKIEKLCVLVYDVDNKFVESFSSEYTDDKKIIFTVTDTNTDLPKGNVTSGSTNNQPSYSHPVQSEAKTAHTEFRLPKPLPFGRYHFYAIANVEQSKIEAVKENIQDVKNITLDWEPVDIPSNNAMFGYFTTDKNTENGADKFDAPLVTINQKTSAIHSWIKRAASKVTVAFDGSNLNQDVRIYIRSVTLKNIPKKCPLGAENSPKEADQLYNDTETILKEHASDPDNYTAPAVIANSQLIYSSDDLVPSDNSGNPEYLTTQPAASWENNGFQTWMKITNGLGNEDCLYGSTHSEDANALFFYENNQGDYDGKEEFSKEQKWENVGTNIISPTQPDFRDEVDNGTYIEVEAYYESDNDANPGRGPIIYRFMLGKNETYNYNAERNHHFKVTLGFNGWANQPDWHIEYDRPAPALDAPEIFRVSYLYNQRHVMPITLSGDCEWVTMEIIENNWAPCYSNGTLAPAGAVSGTSLTEPTAFRWAKVVYDHQQATNKSLYNCTGFLALQVVSDKDGVIAKNILDTEDNSFNTRDNAVNHLNEYYRGKGSGNESIDQAYREFKGENGDLSPETEHRGSDLGNLNAWTVTQVDENTKVLNVPLFTRNKSMIYGSNYGGNNPFEAFDRLAVVEIKAKFKGEDVPRSKKVKVLQVRRIVNPKGVWRSDENLTHEPFTVELMARDSNDPNGNFVTYSQSGSWEAYIEDTADDFFTLSKGKNNQIVENGGKRIIGKTDTDVIFKIDFGEPTHESDSHCGIITVLYNGSNCVHKILVRQGFNEPLQIVEGGAKWSSFSVYGATGSDATKTYNAVLTNSPLALGSYIRRGKVTEAILISNNDNGGSVTGPFKAKTGPYQAPSGASFALYGNARGKTWAGIGRVEENKANAGMGTFTASVNGVSRPYRVPTFKDFKDLDVAEYGFGVLYGKGATKTQKNLDDAFGYIDHNNNFTQSDKGMRGIFVYNSTTGNQIFFPIGKFGVGRRRQFNFFTSNRPDPNNYTAADWYGSLWYGDVNEPLGIEFSYNYSAVVPLVEGKFPGSRPSGVTQEIYNAARTNYNNWNNSYRPLAYNVSYQQGAIYWIDQWIPKDDTGTGSPCMGWDMNYYGFDFSPYTDNNVSDGCILKLVLDN